MKKIVFFLALFSFILTSICFAEKQEWVDKNYNFKQVKRIFIYEPSINKQIINGINEKEIQEIFNKKVKFDNLKIVRLPEMIVYIKADSGIDLIDLYNKNQQQAIQVLNESIKRYADIIICSTVSAYGMGSQYREGFTYNTTNYQTSYVYGPNGNMATVQTPVVESHSVPGGNVPVAYTYVKWDVYDANTLKPVFTRIDNRTRMNETVFDNTEPKDLYGRITESFFDDLNNKIHD